MVSPEQAAQKPKTSQLTLKHEDLVELRKKVNKARQAAMEAQIADLQVQTFQLELAKRYEVADKRYSFDWQLGRITITLDEAGP